MSNLSITWQGDITSIAGSAQYARSIIKGLRDLGVSIKLEPLPATLPQADLDEYWINAYSQMMSASPGYVKISHCNPMQGTPNIFGGPNVLLTHWETRDVPRAWVSTINTKYTHLWTSNQSANTYCEDSGVSIPVDYLRVPISVDPNLQAAELADIDEKTIVFGSTGYWDQRSNFADLIISFLSEFVIEDKVALVLKTGTPDYADPNKRAAVLNMVKEIKKQVNKPSHPPVVIMQDVFTQSAMDSIIKRFDVYVTTERGASTNITMGKCLAMGKPVIASDTDVSQDFARSFKVGNSLMTVVPGISEPVYGYPNGNPLDRWHKPDLDSMIHYMRGAYLSVRMQQKIPGELQDVANVISNRYSQANIIKRLYSTLESMQKKKPTLKLV